MKRKKEICVLIIVLALCFTACGDLQVESSAEETLEEKTITLINMKGEVEEQIQKLAEAYESETGIHVEIITTDAGVNALDTTKGLYLSNQMVDIIACEASDFEYWEGLLADMSDQEWAGRTEAEYVDQNYGTLGFPYTTEAIGLTYNADILSKAGIDPSSLTSPAAYSEAFQKLDEMKDALGLKAVVGYFAEADNLGWSSGKHIFGQYLDAGLSRDDTTYIDLFNNNGQMDKERGIAFANFIGLMTQYSDQELLLTGTYSEQVSNFAAGKYAFVTQGSWIGASLVGEYSDLYSAAGNFSVGMAPYAFSDGVDTILTSSPSWWAVSKQGKVKESKEFIEWCSQNTAQEILVNSCGFISPFSDCQYVASDPFADTISKYISDGKTSSWHWMDMNSDVGQGGICYCFYNYASGQTDASGFIDEIQTTSEKFYLN